MTLILSQIIGVAAVATFLWSYQQKKRKNIILWNAISRGLYILQYVLLGAFSGAVLDILGALSSILAGRRDRGWIQKHPRLVMLLTNGTILAAGLTLAILHRSLWDLLPIAGVLLHTGAFWITDERIIRRISLAGSPFWFIYNLHSMAFGSALGDILTMCSIIIAMLRYRKGINQ